MDSEHFVKTVMVASVNDCLKLANKYGGRVFGHYVRNVLVPMQKDPDVKVHFKRVDLWFVTNEDADNFINDAGDELILVDNYYECYRFGILLFKIKISISKQPPSTGLNVNRLMYQYDGTTFNPRSYTSETVEQLIDSIYHKSAIIDANYLSQINNDPELYQKMQTNYSDWSITFNGEPIFIQYDLYRYIQQLLCL
jgi:hypothetical protein